MNAPLNQPYDGRPELREFAAQQIHSAAQTAETVMRFLELGNDTGAIYSFRCLMAYNRAAAATLKDLLEKNQEDGGNARI